MVSHNASCYAYMQLPLLRPHAKHVCMLMPLVRPHVRHTHLRLHIAVSLNGRATRIWSFCCGFACTTAMGCAVFRLSFGTIFLL